MVKNNEKWGICSVSIEINKHTNNYKNFDYFPGITLDADYNHHG